MMPPDHEKNCHQETDDIEIHDQVMDGLLAAKQYEQNRTYPPLSVQEEMLEINFPLLPEGDVTKQLSEDECQQLRTSLQDNASQKTTQCIANLREQLTEYHSLLDQLSSMTAKYEALQQTCQERDQRVQSLELEVAALKSCPRRVSFPEPGSRCGDGVAQPQQFSPSQQLPMQMMQQQQVQMSNQLFFQPALQPAAPPMNHQAQNIFFNVNAQSSSPFCDTNARRHISPSLSSTLSFNFPSDGFSLNPPTATCDFTQGATCCDEFLPLTSWPKRAISTEYDFSFATGMSVPLQQGSTKRFNSDAFAPAPGFDTNTGQFHLPKAA